MSTSEATPKAARTVTYPVCGWWACDDEEDWETVSDRHESAAFMAAVKREERIARYHQPREEWEKRLYEVRDERNHGEPLWAGK